MTGKDKWAFKYTISGPAQDPFLLVEFKNERAVVLFDCGVRVRGRVRSILKMENLFITHAHIDHFIGFDHLLRALLGENKRLKVFGPPGIRQRVSSKLNAYDWDRAADQELVLEVNEIGNGKIITQTHECRKKFIVNENIIEKKWEDKVIENDLFSIYAAEVDHGGSPCLAYSLVESDKLRINKNRLAELDLIPGPWVGQLLKLSMELSESEKQNKTLEVNGYSYQFKFLENELVILKKGKKISYVTDTAFTRKTLENLIPIIEYSDILFCEATFLEEDKELAERYHHLTAKQSALIAKEARVKKLVLFHVSNRYFPKINRVVFEAREIFKNTELSISYTRNKKSS